MWCSPIGSQAIWQSQVLRHLPKVRRVGSNLNSVDRMFQNAGAMAEKSLFFGPASSNSLTDGIHSISPPPLVGVVDLVNRISFHGFITFTLSCMILLPLIFWWTIGTQKKNGFHYLGKNVVSTWLNRQWLIMVLSIGGILLEYHNSTNSGVQLNDIPHHTPFLENYFWILRSYISYIAKRLDAGVCANNGEVVKLDIIITNIC